MNFIRIRYQLRIMTKKIVYLVFLLFLTNCTVPGSALLGPIYTGAKTGSIYQASLSYSSGKIIKKIRDNESFKGTKKNTSNQSNIEKDPIILLAYTVDEIIISTVEEPEPLP